MTRQENNSFYEGAGPEGTIKMMVNNLEEQEFFLSHFKPYMRVLEYGSGASTLAISPLVNELVSIENNEKWYKEIRSKVPSNVQLYYVPANNSDYKDDGTYQDFSSYIEKPLYLQTIPNIFDIIFIDGRARVPCASICKYLGHEDTIVFIHDYNHPDEKWRRPEYYEAEKYLERIDGVFTMWKFKIKF